MPDFFATQAKWQGGSLTSFPNIVLNAASTRPLEVFALVAVSSHRHGSAVF